MPSTPLAIGRSRGRASDGAETRRDPHQGGTHGNEQIEQENGRARQNRERPDRKRNDGCDGAARRAAPSADSGPAQRPTKQALILGLLQRPEGATLPDLMAATGWLPHTTRAALTRLRQAGHLLEKTTGETGTVYRIATRPAARSRKAA